ncbi:hypothetical protein NKJ50_25395 [Mesorhizobium sp. M0115]|uniref:hypothetical protein n=1 Tax=Mesorhizobium sp. M0115 TaxID=2956883 RepID=UPI003335ED67
MKGWRLVHIDEPQLAFGFGQKAEHPKDGLFLFGPPASNQNPARMDIGIIGTTRATAIYESWVQSIQATIAEAEKGNQRTR